MSNEYLIQARHMGGHRIWLRFNDGLRGEIDLEDYISAIRVPDYEALLDERYFATFLVDSTLTWANGADFAPEVLYEMVEAAQPAAERAPPRPTPVRRRAATAKPARRASASR